MSMQKKKKFCKSERKWNDVFSSAKRKKGKTSINPQFYSQRKSFKNEDKHLFLVKTE